MSPSPAPTSSTPVAIVGAGPVGLSLALGLARQGVRSVLLERKSTTSRTSEAPGLHVRTREVFRQWGVEDRFLAEGKLWQPITMHNVVPGRRPLITLDFSELAAEGLAAADRARPLVGRLLATRRRSTLRTNRRGSAAA